MYCSCGAAACSKSDHPFAPPDAHALLLPAAYRVPSYDSYHHRSTTPSSFLEHPKQTATTEAGMLRIENGTFQIDAESLLRLCQMGNSTRAPKEMGMPTRARILELR